MSLQRQKSFDLVVDTKELDYFEFLSLDVVCECSAKIAFSKHWIAYIRSIISKRNHYIHIVPWCSCDKRFNWIGFNVILMFFRCFNLISCFHCIISKMLYLIWIWTEKLENPLVNIGFPLCYDSSCPFAESWSGMMCSLFPLKS